MLNVLKEITKTFEKKNNLRMKKNRHKTRTHSC